MCLCLPVPEAVCLCICVCMHACGYVSVGVCGLTHTRWFRYKLFCMSAASAGCLQMRHYQGVPEGRTNIGACQCGNLEQLFPIPLIQSYRRHFELYAGRTIHATERAWSVQLPVAAVSCDHVLWSCVFSCSMNSGQGVRAPHRSCCGYPGQQLGRRPPCIVFGDVSGHGRAQPCADHAGTS